MFNPACSKMNQASSTACSWTPNNSVPSLAQGEVQCRSLQKTTVPQDFPLSCRFETPSMNPTRQIQNTFQPTRTYVCNCNESDENKQLYKLSSCSYTDASGNRNVAQAPSTTDLLAINHLTYNVAQSPVQVIGPVNLSVPQGTPPINRFPEALTSTTKQTQGIREQRVLANCGKNNQLQNSPYLCNRVFENCTTTQASPVTYSLNRPTSDTLHGNVQFLNSVNVLCGQNFASNPNGTIQLQDTIETQVQNTSDECNKDHQSPQDSCNYVLGNCDVAQDPSTAYSLGSDYSNPTIVQDNLQLLPPPPDYSAQNFTSPSRQALDAMQTTEKRAWLNKRKKKKNRIAYVHTQNREWKEIGEKKSTHCYCCKEKLETFCFTCEICSSVFCTLLCVKNYDKCSNGSSLCERLHFPNRQTLQQGKASDSSTVTGSSAIRDSQSAAATQAN